MNTRQEKVAHIKTCYVHIRNSENIAYIAYIAYKSGKSMIYNDIFCRR